MNQSIISAIRKDCRMCCSYRNFKPNDRSYRQQVEERLNQLATEQSADFERLRRQDDSANMDVARAREQKYFFLDLVPVCQQCDRNDALIDRSLNKIK